MQFTAYVRYYVLQEEKPPKAKWFIQLQENPFGQVEE